MVNILNIFGAFQAWIIGLIFALIITIVINIFISVGRVDAISEQGLTIIKWTVWVVLGIVFPMAVAFGKDNE